mgnify:CR=1 FL=1
MNTIRFLFYKIISRLCGSDEIMCRLFRRAGMTVGKTCHIYSNILTSENYLICIGDSVTISNGVQLIAHDNSICKVFPEFTDTFGYIRIGSNSFIGAKTVILPGVTLPPNTIVGAGSVVTKSFTEERTIIAGNPAKVVSNWEKYSENRRGAGTNITGLSAQETKTLAIWSAEQLSK